MALHGNEFGNLSVVYRVSSSIDNDWLWHLNISTIFSFQIYWNLVFWIYRICVNLTDINFPFATVLKELAIVKSCDGIPITTFGVISGILVILFEDLDIEENGMTADKDAIVLKNNLLFI